MSALRTLMVSNLCKAAQNDVLDQGSSAKTGDLVS
jgi:hypothetical protein